MFEFLQQNWEGLFAFITGGGLLSIGTAKYARKSAQANVMKEWQGIYQETIKDLRTDKDLLKDDIADLRKVVDQNTVDIEELKSYECIVIDCALRKKRPRTIKKTNHDQED